MTAMTLPKPPSEVWSYQRCELVRVLDGDTIEVQLDLGCGTVRPKETIRLWGINAPEKNTPEGVNARLRVVTLLDRIPFRMETIKDKREKFGRLLALIYPDGMDGSLNQRLVDEGHAQPYDGKGPR